MATDNTHLFGHKNCCECIQRQKEQIRGMYARLYDSMVSNVNSSIDSFNRVSTPIASQCDDCVNRLVSTIETVYEKIGGILDRRVRESKGELEPLCLCDIAGDLKPNVKEAIQQYWDSLNPPFGEPAPEVGRYGKPIEEPLRQSEDKPKLQLQREGPIPEPVPPFNASRVPTSKPECPTPIGLLCCPITEYNYLIDDKLKEQISEMHPLIKPPVGQADTSIIYVEEIPSPELSLIDSTVGG